MAQYLLSGYHAYHATRADLLRRAGQPSVAAAAYERAIALAGKPAEQAFLRRQLQRLDLRQTPEG